MTTIKANPNGRKTVSQMGYIAGLTLMGWSNSDMRVLTSNGDTIDFDLPHGSGIDGDYHLYENGRFYLIHSSFHYMNENGMYMGWIDYTVKIPKLCPIGKIGGNFKIIYHVNSSGRKVAQTHLYDYLDDTYHYAFSTYEEMLTNED